THESFDVLFTCLEAFCRVAAPLLPITVEELYRGLTGERSVHLADYPDAEAFPADAGLVAAMDLPRDCCSTASSVRKANDFRLRPLLRGCRPRRGHSPDHRHLLDGLLGAEVQRSALAPAPGSPDVGHAHRARCGLPREHRR